MGKWAARTLHNEIELDREIYSVWRGGGDKEGDKEMEKMRSDPMR